MDIVRSWRDVPPSLKGAVLAIGNFDGVHRGHQAVLREATRIAKAEGRRSGAVVFEPHPREFFEPDKPFFRLTPLPLKLELLQALGLDQAFVIPFDRELSSLSAETFATDVVGKGLGASHVVVGYDFTYGKGRTGSTQELAGLGRVLGFGVDVVSPVGAAEGTFSSSRIREHLRRGEVREAAEQLGFWWRVRGRVAPGAGRGKGLGFPTLNLALATSQDVRHGIYAMRVYHGGRVYPAAGYVGARPTFGESAPVLEAYLLDFAGDLYGEEVEVEFIAFLRPDQTFATPEALAAQMGEDCDEARAVLAKIDADDPMRRFPLGKALGEPALDCKEPGC
ncbi:MAG: bifunctional riboflavin kinase/FAD synthetase [Methyloceanibacter sp.]